MIIIKIATLREQQLYAHQMLNIKKIAHIIKKTTQLKVDKPYEVISSVHNLIPMKCFNRVLSIYATYNPCGRVL